MSNMKKHIGKIANTDQRCVVVFMQIPGRESHSLVVGTDNLPDRLEHALMQVVESPEGQGDPVLANVLGRRILPDTGKTVLQSLHDLNLLASVPVDNILMMPLPNMPFPLRQIIENMGGTVPTGAAPSDTAPGSAETKYNPYGQTQQIESNEQNSGIARNLLVEADLLAAEAAAKREQAYRYDPSLRPQVMTIETPDTATKTVKKSRAKKTAPAS